MGKKILSFLLAVLLLTSVPVYAADVWQAAESDRYGQKAGGMVGRGLINVATCPFDFVMQTVEKTQEGPPLIGTLTGMGGGLGCTVLRAISGVLDVTTFWVPNFHGFPISKSYSNCLETAKRNVQTYSAIPEQSLGTGWTAPQGEQFSQPVVSQAAPDYQYVKGAPKQHDASKSIKQSSKTTQQAANYDQKKWVK